MTAPSKRIEVKLEGDYDSVELAEELILRVAVAAGFDEENCHRIGMSVREGVINAVQYGSQQVREKLVRVSIALLPEKLEVHVADAGHGFNLADVPDPLAEENLLKTSGRGIFLMRAFMDEFDVRRSREGGAEVVLAKRLPNAPPADKED
jgi:serine/threonine-protein kinase RsbW